jgi:hypothetical protein
MKIYESSTPRKWLVTEVEDMHLAIWHKLHIPVFGKTRAENVLTR